MFAGAAEALAEVIVPQVPVPLLAVGLAPDQATGLVIAVQVEVRL